MKKMKFYSKRRRPRKSARRSSVVKQSRGGIRL